MFLTPQEIQQLTGYESPRYQKRWLISRGWVIALDARGRPIVSRKYAESRLGVDGAEAPRAKARVNLEAV